MHEQRAPGAALVRRARARPPPATITAPSNPTVGTIMVSDECLDVIFRNARTHNSLSGEVTDAQLRAIWDIVKLGPTTANSQPARILFLRSKEARERLKPYLSPGNQDKTM